MKLEKTAILLKKRDALLSKNATRSYPPTRQVLEKESELRTPFQRDRDRVLHTKAFRRLKRKSQVFIAPEGEHYTTRMTHVLEVSQVGRTIARALSLNEDLVEAASLAHDLGHTPFGHIGEEVLDKLLEGGFHHSKHSVRIVTKLEREGRGLNLNKPVIDAIKKHSKPPGEFNTYEGVLGMSLEAQIVRISDAIAYLAHDIEDALRSGWLKENDIPKDAFQKLGQTHSKRIDTMVKNVVIESQDCMQEGTKKLWIRMSKDMRKTVVELRDFMFENFYYKVSKSEVGKHAQDLFEFIYTYLSKNLDEVPAKFRLLDGEKNPYLISDYLCGMTDNYAIAFAERLKPGISKGLVKPFW